MIDKITEAKALVAAMDDAICPVCDGACEYVQPCPGCAAQPAPAQGDGQPVNDYPATVGILRERIATLEGEVVAWKQAAGAANKSLNAAAPDLLDALEAFLRCPSVGSNGPGSSTIVAQDFNLRAARAAIAKATQP